MIKKSQMGNLFRFRQNVFSANAISKHFGFSNKQFDSVVLFEYFLLQRCTHLFYGQGVSIRHFWVDFLVNLIFLGQQKFSRSTDIFGS